jgi:hypothetical protein
VRACGLARVNEPGMFTLMGRWMEDQRLIDRERERKRAKTVFFFSILYAFFDLLCLYSFFCFLSIGISHLIGEPLFLLLLLLLFLLFFVSLF